MAMLSLAGVKFGLETSPISAVQSLWRAQWWDGRNRHRYSLDLNDLIGYTYNVVPKQDD